ncbi:hypothetical protein [Altererythrobacter sp. Root672]|uniref:hypothetical protein n=1 Tax=Altererythrobacter sp. Root672 TaxID=1736584 RepID=UPI0006FE8E77|nr:hypothetical protein [Altererythrobacter sp. Root672]KRA83523.1 hypothetical protein ASD76_05640 [Altererythrobacter sp. Root672]
MTDHPSTFRAFTTKAEGVDWNDHASIHLKDDGGGLLDAMKILYRGTLAEMVAMICRMPEAQRNRYTIQKSGDHRLELYEIMSLAARPDFPG